MERLPTSAWISLALAGAVILVGIALLEPLPPTVTLFWGLPLLVGGIGLWITATFGHDIDWYGQITRGLPVHGAVRVVSALVAAGGVLWLAKQPGAEAAPKERVFQALQQHCHQPGERVERHLLERLELARSYGEDRWDPVLARCLERTREAFARPEGTHRSYQQLRAFLEQQGLEDPVFAVPYRPLEHERLPPTVELVP